MLRPVAELPAIAKTTRKSIRSLCTETKVELAINAVWFKNDTLQRKWEEKEDKKLLITALGPEKRVYMIGRSQPAV